MEILNKVGGIAKPFKLHQESEKYALQGFQYKNKTMWQPCLITTSSASKNVVDKLLVNAMFLPPLVFLQYLLKLQTDHRQIFNTFQAINLTHPDKRKTR